MLDCYVFSEWQPSTLVGDLTNHYAFWLVRTPARVRASGRGMLDCYVFSDWQPSTLVSDLTNHYAFWLVRTPARVRASGRGMLDCYVFSDWQPSTLVGDLTNHYAFWLVRTPARVRDWRMSPSNVYPGLASGTIQSGSIQTGATHIEPRWGYTSHFQNTSTVVGVLTNHFAFWLVKTPARAGDVSFNEDKLRSFGFVIRKPSVRDL